MADYPAVPEDDLDAGGWAERVRTESKVFTTPTAEIIGHTLLYEDAALREALSSVGAAELLTSDGQTGGSRMIETGGGGDFWRFFFATGLTFRPPLAPGIGPASMRPMIVSEARRSFEKDLQARGFEDVERGQAQRVRTDSGDRASLMKFTGTYPFPADAPADALDIEGWLAVWSTGGSFRIAGGAYPIRGLDELLAAVPEAERPETNPRAYRDDLLALVRAVA